MPYLGETPAVGSRSKVNATTTVGTGAEEDTLIKFDGADDSVSSMPATDVGLCKALLARDGYQDRAARDAAR